MNDKVVALILAAGKGTRMKSRRAKVLHPLLGQPLLSYPVKTSKKAGVSKVVAVIGHQAEEVKAAFAGEKNLSFALQSEQKGTAHAVLCAKDEAPDDAGIALILCGDVPLIRPATISKLLGNHKKSGKVVTVLSMEPENPFGYGRLVRDGDGKLSGIVEERDATANEREVGEVNTGTYAVSLPWLWNALEKVGDDNSQGEYYLTDIVKLAAEEGGAESLLLEDPVEVMGINDRAQLAEAETHMRERIIGRWMVEGVSFEDSSSTRIEPSVTIGADVTVGPQVSLNGNTSVGSGSVIGQGCVVTDSTIGEDVLLRPYCVLLEAVVGDAVQAGPFAHLRPKADLRPSSKVGNFVEIKNSTLGEGAKANHLTYLGDATVGARANIGAGTITCNYDGVNKFKTTIGEGAFIGSNSSLVAPVAIGAGSVTGAGSTITKDVEDGAIGIGRGKQRNIPGWKKPVKIKKEDV